ncbi:carboxymuconolactone decarboxylase family protein [Pseudomarimonas salicorniae]|uniref:Carboxymuconolactone decarboxylase family protein n=1 Tax=Pseudomarimonas salicorniae TaxID=2933270 RepID=A0ABT0GE33_9GAMM|nr:carboxymuconolactone decarboxylase family protein [Lysobacter sp. CAU 1642]MCK7592272.1 carboxymuconolactone decarboxylase family protein [Lysobacter sp. CAU 1642]
MSRVALLTADSVDAPRAALLGEIQAGFGALPNMFRAVAHSESALRQMWSSFGALGQGRLDARLGEQIAVAIANRNGCGYCLAAHTALGRKAGASAADMRAAQTGDSEDARTAAALRFALAVVEKRGSVDDSEVEALRAAGFDDGELVEIVGHIALNLFTNYVNLVLDVPLDFPAVELRKAA